MLKKILLAVMLLISLAACQSKSAFNYSENFVKKEQSLIPDINITENKIAKFIALQQYDSIAVAGEKMEKLVDARLQEIVDEPAPDVKEGENFKKAGIIYFKFLKNVYTTYKDYGNAKTPDARDKEMSKLQDIIVKKSAVIQDMTQAQKKYADANGFRIEAK
jgi:hypothetical protein